MRLFEEIGTQLKGLGDTIKDVSRDMRDVSDRLARMEGADQPSKIAKLEDDLHEAQRELGRVERHAGDEIARVERHAMQEIIRIEAVAAADKLALEKRLTRMEIIIGPITAAGSSLLAAVVGAVVAYFTSGLGG